MKLYADAAVRISEDPYEPGQFEVLVANEPYNNWLTVPCTFPSREAAKRVAKAIVEEGIPREHDGDDPLE